MSPARFNRIVQEQLDQLRREGLLDSRSHAELARRYPVERWHWQALGRWFVIFGSLSLAGGLFMLADNLFEFTLKKLAILLLMALAGCFFGGRNLKERQLLWTGRSLELLGGLLLIGLSFTFGAIYSTGSNNWPALLLIDLLILLPLGYLLDNLLLLVLAVVVFFSWFGGMTGYVSGWGAYWFGMNYPARFLLAGAAIAGVGIGHRQAEGGFLTRYQGFFHVWIASGVFFAEMALWLMSLFGNYGSIWNGSHEAPAGELVFFNVLWAVLNIVLLILGARHGLRMLRGFAISFLIIQMYTLYFWQVAEHLGPVLSLFIVGGSALGLVAWFERSRR